MYYSFTFVIFYILYNIARCEDCNMKCPPPGEATTMECGFDAKGKEYKMFPSQCAMDAYTVCNSVELIPTPLSYCIKSKVSESRRSFDESCPVFCPNHYRPVCGASKLRDYVYKTFNNRCYLDMINCRGDEDVSGFVEVPLSFCPRHPMKNIFRGQVVVSNLQDYN